MESTGLPELIQINQASYEMLNSTYPVYACTLRGQIEVKGKGLYTTYWLDRRTDESN